MKSTKRSLLMSTLALILCFSMLLGTTYAWFTDSVTSGVNKIVAGNLDVDVSHTNAYVSTPKSIQDENKMFVDKNGNEMLWEPGAVSYENLTVANVGNLALKYKLNMNITKYNMVAGTGDSLKDAIKVIVLTGSDMLTGPITRETVMGFDWASASTITDFEKSDGVLYPANSAEGESSEQFQLIAYWQPTENDNRWNLNNGKHNSDGFKYGSEEALFIEFGITVIATQKDSEKDSFDEKYDITASDFANSNTDPIVKPLVVPIDPNKTDKIVREPEQGESLSLEVPNKDMTVTYTVGTKLKETTLVAEDNKTADAELGFEYVGENSEIGLTIETDQGIAHYDLTLNIASDNDILNKVTKVVPKNLSAVSVYHASKTPMAKLSSADVKPTDKESFHYDPNKGVLTIWVYHASPIEIVYAKNHVHEGVKHEAVLYCDKAGDGEYYSCSCGAFFSDETCENEIEENSWKGTQPAAHDNIIMLKDIDLSAFGLEGLHTVEFESNYCKRCHCPIAFVDKLDYNFSGIGMWGIGNDYSWTLDASYSFKSFSKKPIIIDGEPSELNVFDLMYQDGNPYINENPENNDPLVNAVFGVGVDETNPLGSLKYLGWDADFEISFNKDIKADAFGLGGNYGKHESGMTMAFLASAVLGEDAVLKAGEPIKMMDSYGGDSFSIAIPYSTIIENVREFGCGIFNNSIPFDPKDPTIATVSLYIYNPYNNGEKLLICSVPYEMQESRASRYAKAEELFNKISIDNSKAYKAVTAEGYIFYCLNNAWGQLEDIKGMPEFSDVLFNEDGTVEYGNYIFTPGDTLYNDNTGTVYEMEITSA